MATYIAPGEYASVVGTPTAAASGISGPTVAILGTSPKGSASPGDIRYNNLADFSRDYGDSSSSPGYTLPIMAQAFFSQAAQGTGVSPGLVAGRVGTALATATVPGGTGSITVTAKPQLAGTTGDNLSVVVSAAAGSSQNVSIYYNGGQVESYLVTDATDGTVSNGLLYALINQQSQYINATAYVNGAWLTAATVDLAGGGDGKGAVIAQADVDLLQTVDCDWVIAGQGDLATAQVIQAHVNLMTGTYGQPRVGFAGFTSGTLIPAMTTNLQGIADPYGRMVGFGHDAVKVLNPSTQVPMLMDGWIGACIAAGIKASNPPQLPLTARRVLWANGPAVWPTLSTMNTLAASGAVLFSKEGGLTIRDGQTTAPYGSTYSSLAVRHCEDVLINRLKDAYRKNVEGQAGGRDVISKLTTVGAVTALQAVNDNIISGYGVFAASESATQAGVYTVIAPYTPMGEVRVVYINLSVGPF